MEERLNWYRSVTNQYEKQLKYVSPFSRINDYRQQLMHTEDQMEQLIRERLNGGRHRLAIYSERLSGLSPLKQLERGYAVVGKKNGQDIHSVEDTAVGEAIQVRLLDGQLEAVVVCGAYRYIRNNEGAGKRREDRERKRGTWQKVRHWRQPLKSWKI